MNSMILGVDDLSLANFFHNACGAQASNSLRVMLSTSKVIHIRSGTILRREVSEKLPQG